MSESAHPVTRVRFVASNKTAGQPLMSARIFLTTEVDSVSCWLSDESKELCESGLYLGDIGNTPVEIALEFQAISGNIF